MALSPQEALARLRQIYRDAHHCDAPSDQHVVDWAKRPERWAEHQIRFRGWTFYAAEATVRCCRVYRRRAAAALELLQQRGHDPYDPLLPVAEVAHDEQEHGA